MRRSRGLAAAALLVAVLASPTASRSEAADLRLFPAPGTTTASPQTQISLRGVNLGEIDGIDVLGTVSGTHGGRLAAHGDGRGASFIPDQPFVPGEVVVVDASVGGVKTGPQTFRVSIPATVQITPSNTVRPESTLSTAVRSRPDLKLPIVKVETRSSDTSSGLMMLTLANGPSGSGPYLSDYAGNVSWFRPLPPGISAANLHASVFRGAPVLMWWEGILSAGKGFGEVVMVDGGYREVGRIRAGNGYQIDLHGVVLLGDTAFVLIYAPVHRPPGIVWDNIVQQIDLSSGLVMSEWHSLDHVGVEESVVLPVAPAAGYDYFHVNSVEVEPSGTLLLSARHTSAIYRIDPMSGEVIWRLGGRRSDFAMPEDGSFSFQHDARRLPDGNITIFNNDSDGRTLNAESSSFLEFALDEENMTASVVRRYHDAKGRLAGSQGSSRRLPNGATFVGWGQVAGFTEFDAAGRVIFDATMEPANSYRALRQPWVGTPATRPDIVFERTAGVVRAFISWNGDTRATTWELLSPTKRRGLARLGIARRPGFETVVAARTNATRFSLRARDARGRILITTPLVTVR